MYLTIQILTIILSFSTQANDCNDWFKSLDIKKNDSACILKCSSSLTDMDSFHCPNQCEDLCNTPDPCKTNPLWGKYFSKFMYFPDDKKKIKTESFSPQDIKVLKMALAKVSDSFLFKDLKIVKMKQNFDPLSSATPSQYIDGHIILFPQALKNYLYLRKYLIHEMFHHFHTTEGKGVLKKYKRDFGWQKNKPRSGNFLDYDSKLSPEEDFTTNLENYVLNSSKIHNKIPNVHKWLKKHIKNKFKLKDCKQ